MAKARLEIVTEAVDTFAVSRDGSTVGQVIDTMIEDHLFHMHDGTFIRDIRVTLDDDDIAFLRSAHPTTKAKSAQ